MTRGYRRRAYGLTLLEAMIALALLEIAVLAANFAVAAGQNHIEASDNTLRAVELAEDLMEEILSRPFDDPDGASRPGPEPGESPRAGFDNADDYYGYRERAGTLTDAAGRRYDEQAQAFTRMSWVWSYRQPVTELRRSIPGLLAVVLILDDSGNSRMIVRFIPDRAS